ncbi:hypothetical protein CXB51_031009 [Gossypium anomalum]|uniref:Uncharacterized protein n=1 Tax=Gossypium anomalum TaxID=47600 RepID=A0A8J6CR41_9ROSI|nr:hypothetical protein CXB51_031009 [Gossypium anomalum]
MGFVLGFIGVYLTMPPSGYSFLKLPRSLEDLHILRFPNLLALFSISFSSMYFVGFSFCIMLPCRDHLESYTSDYTIQVLVGYSVVHIFMQTFMIRGLFSCHCSPERCLESSRRSPLIGRPLAFSQWPDKWNFLQVGTSCRLHKKGNAIELYLFLRLTPTLPNTFNNVASPIVDVPYHIFFTATFIGLIPAAYITVRDSSPLRLRSLARPNRSI